MKRIYRLATILIVCMFIVAGCRDNESKERKGEKEEVGTLEIENQQPGRIDKEDNTGELKPESEQQGAFEASKKVTIYFPNEMADGFETEEIQTTEVTGNWVMEQLVKKGVFPKNVKVFSCVKSQKDGVEILDLDVNHAFAQYLQSMGTTGEYMIMGSVCNTFLDVYQCEKIQITVNGDVLETGHAEYPGYITRYE